MQLGSGIAMAAVYTSGYSSDSIPSLGPSICHGCGPQKTKRKKKKRKIGTIVSLSKGGVEFEEFPLVVG